MGKVHQFVTEHGREKAVEAGFTPPEVAPAAGYLSCEDNSINTVYSGWCSSFLPHKKLADDQTWTWQSEHCGLIVTPGSAFLPDGGSAPVGVPYGSRARLILLYLQSEAARTDSREIVLGRSLRDWMTRMGISTGGLGYRQVEEQAERLARCMMSFHLHRGGRVDLLNQLVVDAAMFLDARHHKRPLFLENAVLSERYFAALKRHPVPLEEAAIRPISNNSQAIDVYMWLAYRLHVLKGPTPVTWKSLAEQFGCGYNRVRDFRKRFVDTLKLALAVYPDAFVEVDEAGVILHPSRPPVAPKMTTTVGKASA